MKLVLFGASGPVGLLLTRLALDDGHDVTAVTRRPESFPFEAPRLTVAGCDLFDGDAVRGVIAGHDAVLSTFGVPYTLKPVSVYSVGMGHILDGMRAAGIRRLIAVTSGGTKPGIDLGEGIFWSLVLKSFIGRTLYADMRRMEQMLFESDVDWIIARPAQLIDTPTVTDYRCAEGYLVDGLTTTSRLDLAHFMLAQLDDETWVGRGVAVATTP